jgi:hypothetical protein
VKTSPEGGNYNTVIDKTTIIKLHFLSQVVHAQNKRRDERKRNQQYLMAATGDSTQLPAGRTDKNT